MITTIILDIEGTITNPRGDVGSRNKELMDKLQILERKGIAIILCSGRDLRYIQNFKATSGLSNKSQIIAENGCVIFDDLEQHVTFNISDYDPEPIRTRLAKTDVLGFAEFDPAKQYMVTLYPKGFLSGAMVNLSIIQEIYEYVRTHLANFELNITYSSASVDIMPSGVDKLHGLKALVSHSRSIELKNTMYIGDSMNDLEIGKFVRTSGGLFCVPQNALPELREVANFVSLFEYEVGVLDILEKYNIN